MTVKDATTWQGWLTAPATFWVSLLVSNAIFNGLPLQAIASSVTPLQSDQVQDTLAISAQQTSSREASAETPPINQITHVAEVTSDTGDATTSPAQDKQGIPRPTTLSATPAESSVDTHSSPVQDTKVPPAQTTSSPISSESPSDVQTLGDVPSVTDFSSTDGEIESNDPMSQVNNVSQLQDVSPGDWAFEALRNLVERYGCIAGYPDGTFRGNRAMTRYEFAAGLNACLQQVERLIASSTTGFVTKQDLEALQRLVAEFRTELTTLGTQVDQLEGRVAFLEDHQFSTTTKLSGLAWFNASGAFADGDVKVETSNLNPPLELRPAARGLDNRPVVQTVTDDPSITLSDLVWLTFQTSFSGRDSLVIQLAAGNGISPANEFASAGLFNTFGTPFFDQTAGPELTNTRNDVVVRDFFYSFPVSRSLQVVVGPRINWYRYFDNNAFTFILTGANTFNTNSSTLLNTIDRGSGAVVLWDINKQFKLRLGYLGENDEFLPGQFGFNSSSNPAKGVFSPTNTATAELTFSPSDALNIRFIYNYSNIDPTVPIFTQLPDGSFVQTGLGIGGAVGEPIYGVADDGFGGSIGNAIAHTFGVNFDWRIASGFGVFGRYTYATTNIDPTTPGRPSGNIDAQSIQAGLAFPDLGKQGALATLSFLIPFDVLGGRRFLAAGGGDGGTQYEFEANYYYPITNNIAIVPAFYFIGNVNNFSDNPNIYVGNLRAQFSF
jgi:hypothetical protein